MPIIEKLTIPPLYTHSIDYDNNLTIYEAYGAMLHTINETIESLNNVTQILLPALTKRVSQNEKNITLLLEYVDTLQQQMTTLLNTTIPAINSTLANHSGRIETNENDIEKLKNDIITINSSLHNINSAISDIEVNIRNLQNDYNSLNILTIHHSEELNTINLKIEEIQTILNNFNTKITANENNIVAINTELTEINQKIDNLNIDELNTLLQQIKTDIDQANSIIEQFSRIETSQIVLNTSITSISGVVVLANKIEKNGKICNLVLQINGLKNFVPNNQVIDIGIFNPGVPGCIPLSTKQNRFIGNSSFFQEYIKLDSSDRATEYEIMPCIVLVEKIGNNTLLQIKGFYPSNHQNINNNLYINIQYFTN